MMELMENDEQIVEYPLSKFKETASYKNNINIWVINFYLKYYLFIDFLIK